MLIFKPDKNDLAYIQNKLLNLFLKWWDAFLSFNDIFVIIGTNIDIYTIYICTFYYIFIAY